MKFVKGATAQVVIIVEAGAVVTRRDGCRSFWSCNELWKEHQRGNVDILAQKIT
jgi:hypothetical protein